jgi:hypothetical protein
MKRKLLLPIFLISGILIIIFYANKINGQTQQHNLICQQSVMYTCTMHPEVLQNKPGNCPKCEMKLVEKKEMAQGEMQHAKDSACMNKNQMKMMNDSTSSNQNQSKM